MARFASHPIACASRSARVLPVVVFGAVVASGGTAAHAQTIIVDTAADVVDFGGQQRVSDLPGPDGKVSLAEAGLASDNTPGIQTIAFHVPKNEWEYQWLYPGRAVLTTFLGFTVFQPVIVDATTQTAFTGDTNPDGGEVVLFSQAYLNNSVGSLVRGLDHTMIQFSGGSSNLIQGNSACGITVYDSPLTVVGGTNPGEGNTGGGFISIDRSSDNVVVGNTTGRVRVLGGGLAEPQNKNARIGGPSMAERNYITGYGFLDGEACPTGDAVQIFQTTGTIIENNWIGTTPDGMSKGNPYTVIGINIDGESYETVIRNNRIAGIRAPGQSNHCPGVYGTAIQVVGTGSGLTITGNTLGLNVNNQPVLGSVTGIGLYNHFLGPIKNITIGGAAPAEGNEIADNLFKAIVVDNKHSGVRISGNSIHDSGDIGIDLLTMDYQYGVTPNDPLDADVGANGLQNYPDLVSAVASGSGVSITGTLSSSPSVQYRIECFASGSCDPSGHGEGERYLGAFNVTTSASGSVAFVDLVPGSAQPGEFVTATATRVISGDTSEFSSCVPVIAGACYADCDASTSLDIDDFICFQTFFALGDPYADCDADGSLTIDDFICFQTVFALGC